MGSFKGVVGKGIIDLLSSNPKMNFLYEEGRGMGSFKEGPWDPSRAVAKGIIM